MLLGMSGGGGKEGALIMIGWPFLSDLLCVGGGHTIWPPTITIYGTKSCNRSARKISGDDDDDDDDDGSEPETVAIIGSTNTRSAAKPTSILPDIS